MIKKSEESRINPSYGRGLPSTNNSRGQQVTDINGFNDNA